MKYIAIYKDGRYIYSDSSTLEIGKKYKRIKFIWKIYDTNDILAWDSNMFDLLEIEELGDNTIRIIKRVYF